MKTTEDNKTLPEGKTFDRKSARIEPKALAVTMVALANADGGTIVIGIEDDGSVSGIDGMEEHINDLLRVPFDYCVPSVNVRPQRIPCIDREGKENHILVLEVEQSSAMHSTTTDEAYRELEEGGWLRPLFKQDDFMLRASLVANQSGSETSPDVPNDPNPIQMDLNGQILSIIESNPSVSRRELAERLGISERRTRDILKEMQEGQKSDEERYSRIC